MRQARSISAEAHRRSKRSPQASSRARLSPSSLTLAVAKAEHDVRAVSDVIQDGLPGQYDEPFIIRKDRPIKSVDDIKGKRIATNAIGSASDLSLIEKAQARIDKAK